MESKLGLVAKLTKQQTNRGYFSEIPIGTRFIIIAEHIGIDMSDYDLTGYFLYYPPQQISDNHFHYTGYIERGSWEILGTVEHCLDANTFLT